MGHHGHFGVSLHVEFRVLSLEAEGVCVGSLTPPEGSPPRTYRPPTTPHLLKVHPQHCPLGGLGVRMDFGAQSSDQAIGR